MKRVINSIFAYFGQKPLFPKANFDRANANYAVLISIEQQAIDFVHNALKVVNNQVRSELKRNGYDPNDALTGKIVVSSYSHTSHTDNRFKTQAYHVDGFVVLCVKWKPNGFTMETNTASVATDQKKLLKNGYDIGRTLDIESIKRGIELDALTNKKIIEGKRASIVK